MDRYADGPRLVGDATGDRLPDPPGGVGRELVAAPVVELLDGADQSQVALLDEVEQGHAAAQVFLGDGDHQPKVGLDHVALGFQRADLDPLCQLDLLRRGQQGHVADLLEVHPHGVVERAPVLELGGFDGNRGQLVLFLFLVGADHDAKRPESLEDGLGRGRVELGEGDQDVGGIEAALFHAGEDQRLGARHQTLISVPAVVLLDPQCHGLLVDTPR